MPPIMPSARRAASLLPRTPTYQGGIDASSMALPPRGRGPDRRLLKRDMENGPLRERQHRGEIRDTPRPPAAAGTMQGLDAGRVPGPAEEEVQGRKLQECGEVRSPRRLVGLSAQRGLERGRGAGVREKRGRDFHNGLRHRDGCASSAGKAAPQRLSTYDEA